MTTVWWLLFVVVACKIASVEAPGNIVERLRIFYAILHTFAFTVYCNNIRILILPIPMTSLFMLTTRQCCIAYSAVASLA